MTGTKEVKVDAKGIPLKQAAYPDGVPVAAFYTILHGVFLTIGYGIASYLYSRTKDTADAKLAIISSYDLGWLYAGILLVKFLQIPITITLGNARKDARICAPDQHVYKIMGNAEGTSKLGYVLMEQEGPLGKFNRGQRALMNYYENFATLALQYVATSFVFPKESCVCFVIWGLARCISAVGYVSSTGGRMNGFLPDYLAMNVIGGMTILIIFKTLM